jgi:hypothetical protein
MRSSIVTAGCAEFQQHFLRELKHKSHSRSINRLSISASLCKRRVLRLLLVNIHLVLVSWRGYFEKTCEAPSPTSGERQGLCRALRLETCQLDHDTLQCSQFGIFEMQIKLVVVSGMSFFQLSQLRRPIS